MKIVDSAARFSLRTDVSKSMTAVLSIFYVENQATRNNDYQYYLCTIGLIWLFFLFHSLYVSQKGQGI